MSIVDEGNNHFAFLIKLKGLVDELFFTGEISSFGINFEGLAQDAENSGISVEGSPDGSQKEALFIVERQSGFDGRFSGSRLSEKQAETALLAVNGEGVKDELLVFKKSEFSFRRRIEFEGILGNAKEVSDVHNRGLEIVVIAVTVVGLKIKHTGTAHALVVVVDDDVVRIEIDPVKADGDFF